MDRERIEKAVIEIVAEIANERAEQLKMETHFVNDLQLDSLDLMELTMKLEEEFELSVPDEDGEKLRTIGEVVDYVDEKLKEVVSGEKQ
jgi:acyl carrier protein